MIKKFLSFLISVSFILCMSGCSGNTQLGSLELELNSTPKSLDPLLAESFAEKQVVLSLFEGLFRSNSSGEPIYACAQTHSVSNDGKVYTFTLREDLMWSDKQPLTAHDFVFGFKRAVLPETASPYAYNLFDIENAQNINNGTADVSQLGVKATDDRTLVVTLQNADKNFLLKLCTLAAMPCREDFFEGCGGRYGLGKKYVISNAGYYLSSWVDEYTDKEVVLRRNSQYTGNFEASLARVSISFDGTDDRIDRLNKEITCAAVADGEIVQEGISSGLGALTYQQNCMTLLFNTANEHLSDIPIRRALSRSIDRDTLAEILPEHCTIAYDLVPLGTSVGMQIYRTDSQNTVLEFDLQGANADFNEYISKTKEVLPTFTIIYSDPLYKSALSHISQVWQKEFGIYTIPKEVSKSELDSMVASDNYDIAVYPFSPDDGTVYSVIDDFLSSGKFSIANTDFDSAVSDAAHDQDDSSAIQKFTNAEKILLENASIVPLFFSLEGFIYNSDVQQINFYPHNTVLDLTNTTVKYKK